MKRKSATVLFAGFTLALAVLGGVAWMNLRDAALAQESARWVAYTQQVLRVMQREQIQTRAIVLTSFPYPQYEQRVRAAGAYAFLNKAKEFGRVADLVRSLLPGSGQTVEKPV